MTRLKTNACIVLKQKEKNAKVTTDEVVGLEAQAQRVAATYLPRIQYFDSTKGKRV